MPPIVECVPNFSEGRDPAVTQALITAITSVPGVLLLHQTMDQDHHRSVLTFAGPPDAVGEAALRAISTATNLIDLRQHAGVHPRIGATDVVPFIPIRDIDMDECARLARSVGQEVGTRLGIPVFLYEQAAVHQHRRRLETIRSGGLTGLASRMEHDPTWHPDFGPHHLHETAGATVIGARHPLIAFNVNLKTNDLSVAKDIARSVRESTGGFPCVKAIGVELASRSMVQVAMNLTDYHVTPMHKAFQAVTAEATQRGVHVTGSELIGLAPQAAFDQVAASSLRLEQFDPTSILETRITHAMSSEQGPDQTLSDFFAAVAAAKPTPGGGSVAALVGALAASLGIMGARLGNRSDEEHRLMQLQNRLHQLVQEDVRAYGRLIDAYKIPKHDPKRPHTVATALHRATEIPLEIAESACEAGRLLYSLSQSAKSLVHSDLTVGLHMAIAAATAGCHTAKCNINYLLNHELRGACLRRVTETERSLEELKRLCYTPPPIV